MNSLSRRRFFGSVAVAASTVSWPTILTNRAYAGTPTLVPRKLPFPPNDQFGTYEPTISADGNTIYYARFFNNGDTRVKGPSDIFVTHRVRQGGEWPGTAEDWSPAERLPDCGGRGPDQPWSLGVLVCFQHQDALLTSRFRPQAGPSIFDRAIQG